MKLSPILLILFSVSLLWVLKSNPSSSKDVWSQSQAAEVSIFGDSQEGGDSKFNHWKMDSNGIHLDLSLSQEFEYPYLGLRFEKSESKQSQDCYNLEFYDSLAIDFEPLGPVAVQGASFQIWTRPPKGRPGQEIILQKGFNLQTSQIQVALEEFEIPEWFLLSKKVQADELEPWYSNTCRIEIIFSDKYLQRQTQYQLRIKSIRLIKKTEKYFYSLSFFIGFLWLIGIIFWILKRFKKEEPESPSESQLDSALENQFDESSNSESPQGSEGQAEHLTGYKAIELTPKEEEWWQEIQEIVKEEYLNPDFSTETLSESIHLTQRKTSAIIRDKTGLTLKAWVAEIRLQEAARLLKETQEQVVQIAYQLGYSSANHFNRQFKSKYQCTPTEYRDHHSC